MTNSRTHSAGSRIRTSAGTPALIAASTCAGAWVWCATRTSRPWACRKAATANALAERGYPSIRMSVAGSTSTPWPRALAARTASPGERATSVFAS